MKNHFVKNASFAKWLSVRLWTMSKWVQVQLQSPKLQFYACFKQQSQVAFTLTCGRDMAREHIAIQSKDLVVTVYNLQTFIGST